MIGIFQKRKIDLSRPRVYGRGCGSFLVSRLLSKQRQQFFGVFVGIDTHCEDLRFIFGQQVRQLSELLNAVGSPMAAIENQDDGVFSMKLGESNPLPIFIFKRKVRSWVAHFDTFKISRNELISILRTNCGASHSIAFSLRVLSMHSTTLWRRLPRAVIHSRTSGPRAA